MQTRIRDDWFFLFPTRLLFAIVCTLVNLGIKPWMHLWLGRKKIANCLIFEINCSTKVEKKYFEYIFESF